MKYVTISKEKALDGLPSLVMSIAPIGLQRPTKTQLNEKKYNFDAHERFKKSINKGNPRNNLPHISTNTEETLDSTTQLKLPSLTKIREKQTSNDISRKDEFTLPNLQNFENNVKPGYRSKSVDHLRVTVSQQSPLSKEFLSPWTPKASDIEDIDLFRLNSKASETVLNEDAEY
jgi:hypothetical protein